MPPKKTLSREEELMAAFQRAREAGWEPPPEFEYTEDPADRYAMLPRTTRKWFETLRPEDIMRLEAAGKFYEKALSIGKFNFWVLTTIVAASTLGVTFGENVMKMLSWFTHKGP